jgi:nicotinamide mononucleotide transporter
MIKALKRYFEDWSIWEKAWLFSFTAIIIGLSIFWQDSIIGITASLTGIWCVVLVAKGRIANYWFGFANVLAYAYVAYMQKYYGEVMLNLFYFFPMQFVGIWIWLKHKDRTKVDSVKVKFLSNKWRFIWAGISAVAVIGYGLILKAIGGELPFIDSTSTVLSVIAMILMAWRFMEQWVLWIIVDVVSVIMWIVVLAKGGTDISVLLMWTAYLINAIYGFVNWIKLYKAQPIEA